MSQEGKGLQVERNCPLLEERDKAELQHDYNKSAVRKYDLKSQNQKKKEEAKNIKEEDEIQKKIILKVLDYEFFECPVATFNENKDLTALQDLVNWSLDMHTPLIDGGLLHHTNYYFQCHRTIVNEQRSIENEEMKQSRSKAKNKGQGSPQSNKSKLGKTNRASRR
jgi:hypothetical protein